MSLASIPGSCSSPAAPAGAWEPAPQAAQALCRRFRCLSASTSQSGRRGVVATSGCRARESCFGFLSDLEHCFPYLKTTNLEAGLAPCPQHLLCHRHADSGRCSVRIPPLLSRPAAVTSASRATLGRGRAGGAQRPRAGGMRGMAAGTDPAQPAVEPGCAVTRFVFLLSSSSPIPGARLVGRDPQREDGINPRKLRGVPIARGAGRDPAERFMVSMASAGSRAADRFAPCLRAARCRGRPHGHGHRRLRGCRRASLCRCARACRRLGEVARLSQHRAEAGDA